MCHCLPWSRVNLAFNTVIFTSVSSGGGPEFSENAYVGWTTIFIFLRGPVFTLAVTHQRMVYQF